MYFCAFLWKKLHAPVYVFGMSNRLHIFRRVVKVHIFGNFSVWFWTTWAYNFTSVCLGTEKVFKSCMAINCSYRNYCRRNRTFKGIQWVHAPLLLVTASYFKSYPHLYERIASFSQLLLCVKSSYHCKRMTELRRWHVCHLHFR